MNAQRPPTRDDLTHYLGPLDDQKVMEILCLEPSWKEIEVAAAHLAGADDIMGKKRKPLSGKAAAIHEIVTREELYVQEQ